MAAKVGGEGQQAAYKKLNADPPSGWYTGPPWYGERPKRVAPADPRGVQKAGGWRTSSTSFGHRRVG
jgi:hypothetical protein